MNTAYDFSVELGVTKAYQQAKGWTLPQRELACLRVMYPALFRPIRFGDLFAGRLEMSFVGVSPEPGGLGYYCDQAAIEKKLAEHEYPAEMREQVRDMLRFWKTETTAYKLRSSYPPSVQAALPSDRWTDDPLPAAPLYRMAGTYMDFEKLLREGIPGLLAEVQDRKPQNPDLFSAMEGALDRKSVV